MNWFSWTILSGLVAAESPGLRKVNQEKANQRAKIPNQDPMSEEHQGLESSGKPTLKTNSAMAGFFEGKLPPLK